MCYGTCSFENRDGECAFRGRGPRPCEEEEYILDLDPDYLRDCAREREERKEGGNA